MLKSALNIEHLILKFGMAVIEHEADPKKPVPALKNCVETMRRLAD